MKYKLIENDVDEVASYEEVANLIVLISDDKRLESASFVELFDAYMLLAILEEKFSRYNREKLAKRANLNPTEKATPFFRDDVAGVSFNPFLQMRKLEPYLIRKTAAIDNSYNIKKDINELFKVLRYERNYALGKRPQNKEKAEKIKKVFWGKIDELIRIDEEVKEQ